MIEFVVNRITGKWREEHLAVPELEATPNFRQTRAGKCLRHRTSPATPRCVGADSSAQTRSGLAGQWPRFAAPRQEAAGGQYIGRLS